MPTTDELRAELRDLAAELPTFELNRGDLGRRNRNHRALVGAIAAVIAIAVAAGVFAGVSHRRASRVEVANDKEVAVAAFGRPDVVVTPASDRVRAALDRSPVVRRYTELARGTLNGALPPRATAPGAVCAISAESGFVVQLTTSDRATSSRLAADLGNSAHVYPWWLRGDFEIFMKVDAIPAQVASLANRLHADRTVAHVDFLDHAAAYNEFKRDLADQPALIQGTTPANVPESFRVTLVVGASPDATSTRYERLPGADVVIRSVPLSTTLSRIPKSSAQRVDCKTP